MRCGCAIGGVYRVRIRFRSGFGFGFGFRLGTGGCRVVVVRGVFIDGGESLEGGSDSGGAEEGGRGSGELTASMADLRLHGWDGIGWLVLYFFCCLFLCFFRDGFILRWELSEKKRERRGGGGETGRDFYSYLAVTGSSISIEFCFLRRVSEGSGGGRGKETIGNNFFQIDPCILC